MTGRPSDYTPEIYALTDPTNGETRYIGKANNPKARLKSHIRDSAKRKTPVYAWIRDLISIVQAPNLHILEVCTHRDWQSAEQDHIKAARAQGTHLLNVAHGGNEPHCPLEVRQANGKKVALLHSDPIKKRIWGLKKAIGSMLKAGLVSESAKQKLRIAAQKAPHIFGKYAAI